jgi:hypothetical protein
VEYLRTTTMSVEVAREEIDRVATCCDYRSTLVDSTADVDTADGIAVVVVVAAAVDGCMEASDNLHPCVGTHHRSVLHDDDVARRLLSLLCHPKCHHFHIRRLDPFVVHCLRRLDASGGFSIVLTWSSCSVHLPSHSRIFHPL